MTPVAETYRSGHERRDSAQQTLRRFTFRAMGTSCELQYTANDSAGAAAFERAVMGWVSSFEAKFSRFREDSVVSRINAAAGREWMEIDDETEQLLRTCDTLYFLTEGILDPTALPLIRLWDYKAAEPKIPSDEAIAAARRCVGWRKVQREASRVFLPSGMALDFGGFGKEYAVDAVARLALSYGVSDVLVDFGHDLRGLGRPADRPAWHIGLEDPRKPGSPAGSIALMGNRGVASSGDYVRRFVIEGRRYGHIIDPRSGRPVANGCLQATVIANTCLQAGVLSTTAFVLGGQRGIEFIQSFPGAEGLIVTETARFQTRGFYNYVVS
jgi:thiamine biosynthesis lipoprotein